MSQITIGGTTLNFKDSAFTGDQWEQVASWVLNGGAEGIDANAQIATEKAAAASASAATARNSATSAGESASAAAKSATAAKASEDAATGSATNAAASATSAGNSAAAASERADNAANSASVASSKSNDAIAAASDAQAAKNKAANSQAAAKKSEDNAAASATSAANSAASASSSATAAANSAASASESIKHAPRINADGKWELWDATTNAYVATEYTAIGKDGTKWWTYAYPIGITAALEKIMSKSNLPDADIGDYVLHTMSNAGIVFEITGETEDGSSWVVKEKCTLRGTDGITPHIGANGNWYIGDTDTGVSAGGASYIFKVTVVEGTGGPDTLSANKTFSEIKSAYSSGSMVVVQHGSSLYELTYVGNTKVEFTHVNETYCDVLSCTNSGSPQEIDGWMLNRTKRINYDTKYGDIGQKTVPVAIKELQDKSAPTVTDSDAGKYLHVNASTKNLEWAEVKSGGGSELPAVTAADAGKFLRVSSSGSWVAETVANANGGEF